MALLYDRVGVTTATTGTGTLTLGSAITDAVNGDFLTFADAGVANASVVNYLITNGNNFELGTGTYTVSGTTLTRGATLSKTAGTKGTGALTLVGASNVYIVPQAAAANAFGGLISTPAANGYSFTDYPNGIIFKNIQNGAHAITFMIGGIPELAAQQGRSIARGFGLGTSSSTALTTDVFVERDAANTLARRNGTAAQTDRLYNTYTDASNGEWSELAWSSNVCYLRPKANGTGTQRLLVVSTGATTVAGLPSASSAGAGARAFVTDGSADIITGLGTVVTGNQSNKVPVYSDGTNWLIG